MYTNALAKIDVSYQAFKKFDKYDYNFLTMTDL